MVHEASPLRATLAANLRRLRIARQLSLSELARATAMSKATLSGIENGNANPTVETLAMLAAALRVPIAELLEAPALGEVRIVRAASTSAPDADTLARRSVDRLAAAGDLEITEVMLPGHHQHESPALGAGCRAHLYVVEGKLIAGPASRCTELGPGDYISYPADVPQVLETTGARGARALILTQRPSR